MPRNFLQVHVTHCHTLLPKKISNVCWNRSKWMEPILYYVYKYIYIHDYIYIFIYVTCHMKCVWNVWSFQSCVACMDALCCCCPQSPHVCLSLLNCHFPVPYEPTTNRTSENHTTNLIRPCYVLLTSDILVGWPGSDPAHGLKQNCTASLQATIWTRAMPKQQKLTQKAKLCERWFKDMKGFLTGFAYVLYIFSIVPTCS